MRRAREALVARGDPLVPFCVDGFDLELPLSHGFPRYRALHPSYDANIGRIAAAIAGKHPGGSAVDIGANVGDTAAIIRGACSLPILCVEGNEAFYALLQLNARNLGGGIFLEKALVGDPVRALGGEMQTAHGTARVVERCGAPRIPFERLQDLLGRRTDVPPPCFVKIDTDGFDVDIILASEAVWRRHRPAIFFEYDPALQRPGEDAVRALDLLASVGYRTVLVYENTGEYVLTLDATNRAAFEDLDAFYSDRASERYADLCAFHVDDADVAAALRESERRLSREARSAPRR